MSWSWAKIRWAASSNSIGREKCRPWHCRVVDAALEVPSERGTECGVQGWVRGEREELVTKAVRSARMRTTASPGSAVSIVQVPFIDKVATLDYDPPQMWIAEVGYPGLLHDLIASPSGPPRKSPPVR